MTTNLTQGADCTVQELILGRAVRAVRLQNELMAVTVLPDKGADVYELTYLPKNVDVLWKSPWGLAEPGNGVPTATQSLVAWVDGYAGGWQELFPNGGANCVYRGVELNYHGEASMSGWDYEILESGGLACEVSFSLRLRRSPFRIRRNMRLESGKATLTLQERITNEGGEALEYMWGHHPAFGAPFLSDKCRVDVGAASLTADDIQTGPTSPLPPGAQCAWPLVQAATGEVDLSRVPGQDACRQMLAYFTEWAANGWYAITNTELGFGVGFAWPLESFDYAWLWQEAHATPGYPWYKGIYVMAIEPNTSLPAQGLAAVIEKSGTQRTLAPGASASAQLTVVFFEGGAGVQNIGTDGGVKLR